MQTGVWEHRVLLFSIACHGVLLWRLWSQKLAGVYPFLTIFLTAETVQNIVIYPIRPRSDLYGWVYLLSTPVLWILAYLVVLELYRLILEDYPGIASVGRKAVTWCMGLAIFISVAYAIPDLRTSTGQFPILRIYFIVERSTVLGLLLFLVLIQVFLIRYKLPVISKQNCLRHRLRSLLRCRRGAGHHLYCFGNSGRRNSYALVRGGRWRGAACGNCAPEQ